MNESTEKKVALYRHYDENNILLYIGISLSAVGRLKQHQGNAGWTNDATLMSTEWFDSREQALKAESEAIGKENPLFNIAHVKKNKLIPQSHKLASNYSNKELALLNWKQAIPKKTHNNQILFFSGMLSRMDSNNIVQMSAYTKKEIISEIEPDSKDKLCLARQYIKTLSDSGVIAYIGDGAYMITPKLFGFSSIASSADKKQDKFIKIKYSKKGREIFVGKDD